MKLNIELGNDFDGMNSVMPHTAEKPEKHYPMFHTHTEDDLDLPREGTLVIRYCVHRAVSTKDEDGKHTYDCDIEVKELVSVQGEKKAPARSGHDAEDALDRIAEEHYGERE